MIKLENLEVVGWKHAIRGMRNAFSSWDKSDSKCCMYDTHNTHCKYCPYVKYCNADDEDMYTNYIIGPNDHDLMLRLAKSGSSHAKYRRMIVVYVDIVAPWYWWKDFDTYKVGTVANSCSTRDRIQNGGEFTLEDFSYEHLTNHALKQLKDTIKELETLREYYIHWDTTHYSVKEAENWTNKKEIWDEIVQLLPNSFNQRRTVMMNYEVLASVYKDRKNHLLKEFRDMCDWIKTLPYSELITLGGEVNGEE